MIFDLMLLKVLLILVIYSANLDIILVKLAKYYLMKSIALIDFKFVPT